MASLEIRKKGQKNFWHYSGSYNPYSASDYSISFDGNNVKLARFNGAPIFERDGFDVMNISIYDDTVGGSEETFTNVIQLEQRLIDLGYNAFYLDGDINLSTYALKSRRFTDAAVTGTYNIDLDTYDTFDLTLTGATVLDVTSTLASDEVKPFTIYVTGDFDLDLSAFEGWSGTYDGTKLNRITGEQRTNAITCIDIFTKPQ